MRIEKCFLGFCWKMLARTVPSGLVIPRCGVLRSRSWGPKCGASCGDIGMRLPIFEPRQLSVDEFREGQYFGWQRGASAFLCWLCLDNFRICCQMDETCPPAA